MPITTETPGANSMIIKFNGTDTVLDIANLIKTFLTTHGWEALDATYYTPTSPTGYNTVMTYRSLNKDGVTYKYMQIRFVAHTHVRIATMEGYTVSGNVIYNETITNHPNPTYGQRIPSDVSIMGALFISASNRWCIIQTQSGDLFGSSLSGGWEACLELTQAQTEDDPELYPTFASANAYAFCTLPSTHGVMGPVRSKLGTGNNAKTRAITPVTSWGQGLSGPVSTLGYSVNPFNNKHNAFDVGSAWDCSGDCGYFKGYVYGMKVFQCGIGQLGDKMRVKTNEEYFVDPAGEDTDFMIFTDNSRVSIGFPL